MNKFKLLLVCVLANMTITAENDLISCNKSLDCNDGEVCVSYKGCKKQNKHCIPTQCHRSGANCPSSIHCSSNGICHNISCK